MIAPLGSEASAQSCAGSVSFNFAPAQLAAVASSAALGATVGYGTDLLFGVASALFGDDDDGRRIGVTVGTDQPMRVDNSLRFCPAITVAHGDAGTELVGRVDVGWRARNSAGVSILPSMGIAYGSEDAGGVDAALGFVLRSRYALTPRVSVPWRAGDRTSVGIALVVGIR